MDINASQNPSATVEKGERKVREEDDEDGNGADDVTEMCVRLNIDQIQNITKGHEAISHEDHAATAAWFAGWRVTERPVEAQRQLKVDK